MIWKRSVGEKIFDVCNYAILILFAFTCLYPFLNTIVVSLSTPAAANTYGLKLFPQELNFEAYKAVFDNRMIWVGFENTLFRTIVGTVLNVIFTVLCAYPLSKRKLPNRNFYTFLIIFTLFFNGGLIPTYLLVRELGMIDTHLALIIPNLINAFWMIIVRNYFMSLPEEVEESAKIDGANEVRILFSIVLPISVPIVATISLWYAVMHWNAWFDALLYITDPDKTVVQMVLRKIVIEGSPQFQQFEIYDPNTGTQVTPDIIKAATVMVATFPILCVYPFIQKYFVKGVMIGSLKG